MNRVVVVGGGAAGMFAAGIAAQYGGQVVLIERNDRLGKKLHITGKGRCNVTNSCTVEDVLKNVATNSRFLFSSLNRYSPQDVMNFFEELGVPLKTERGGRVFPESDKASDIVNALKKFLKDTGVKILLNTRVKEVLTKDNIVYGVVHDKGKIECDKVILATGGISYPATGSTGDGYRIAEKLGHKVVDLRGSLVPLVCEQKFCADMQGLSLRNVQMSVYNQKGKCIFSEMGEMLFTHFGISGPLALSASSLMRDLDKEKYKVKIDLKPALDEKKLDNRLLRDFEKYSNRDFSNALGDLYHKKMIPVIIELSEISPDAKVHSITKSQRRKLLEITKGLEIDVLETRPIEEAIITSGGINVKEISPATMESKLVEGLFFAGEIIDADAYTGGYNLQIAWSTAYAAAIQGV